MPAAIEEQVRFARRRFGRYELIDFVAVLFGYAISGERTLQAFYEQLQPWASAFMALFGRDRLPARSTLSRFLASLDQAAVEARLSAFSERSAGSSCRARGAAWRPVGPAGEPLPRFRHRWDARSCPPTCFAEDSRSACTRATLAPALCAWLHGAQAGGSCPHAHDSVACALAPVVNDKWSRIEEADRQS